MRLSDYFIAAGICGYLALSGCSDSDTTNKNPIKTYINARDEVFREVMQMRMGIENKVQAKNENPADLKDKE